MSKQHTPGPWFVAWEESKNPDRILVQSEDGVDVAEVFLTLEQKGFHTGNAHMIAATPDLLAFAQMIADESDYKYQRDAARAVIAKATGAA